jgi:transcriptional regulator with XRE-family HTH domain
MTDATDWGAIVAGLLKEHRASQRRVCAQIGLNRTTLRRSIIKSDVSLADLSAIAGLFGYEVDLIKVGPSNYVPLPAREPKAEDERSRKTKKRLPAHALKKLIASERSLSPCLWLRSFGWTALQAHGCP